VFTVFFFPPSQTLLGIGSCIVEDQPSLPGPLAAFSPGRGGCLPVLLLRRGRPGFSGRVGDVV